MEKVIVEVLNLKNEVGTPIVEVEKVIVEVLDLKNEVGTPIVEVEKVIQPKGKLG